MRHYGPSRRARALGRCETRGSYYFPQGVSRVLIIADNLELVCQLLEVTDRHGAHLYQSHSAIDLIALGNLVAAIVDRRLCEPDDWAAFGEYLTELEGEVATPLILIDENTPFDFAAIDPLRTSPEGVA